MKGSGAKSVQIITDTDPDPDYTENPRKSSLKLYFIFLQIKLYVNYTISIKESKF